MRKERQDVLVWLKRNELSQVGFAMELGVSHATVQNWIHYGTEPSRLARELIEKKYPKCPLLSV